MVNLWLVAAFTAAWRTKPTVPSTAPAPVDRKRVSLRSCIRFRKPFKSGGEQGDRTYRPAKTLKHAFLVDKPRRYIATERLVFTTIDSVPVRRP